MWKVAGGRGKYASGGWPARRLVTMAPSSLYIDTRYSNQYTSRGQPWFLRKQVLRFAQDDRPGRAFLKKEIGCHPMITGLLLLLQLGTPVYDRVILGGHVMDPASRLDAVRNIGLSRGRIAVITSQAIRGRDTIDARGLVVAPGFIDLHAHGQTPETYRFYALDGVTTALELELGT